MQFNPDPNKQARNVHSLKKVDNVSSLPVTFNNTNVAICCSQKYSGLVFDEQLKFIDHIQSKMTKCYKLIGIVKKLSVNIPRDALLRIYKAFIRPHLDNGDNFYDKPNNESFKSKIENIHYKGCTAITGVIQGISHERLYQELGLESLEDRRWY